MSRNNYSKFSSKKFKENKDGQIAIAEVIEDVKNEETVEAVIEEVVVEKVEIKGIVVGCSKLAVRKEANTDSDRVSVIDENTEVIVDTDNSTDDFYKINIADNVEGYCMKKFIKIV